MASPIAELKEARAEIETLKAAHGTALTDLQAKLDAALKSAADHLSEAREAEAIAEGMQKELADLKDAATVSAKKISDLEAAATTASAGAAKIVAKIGILPVPAEAASGAVATVEADDLWKQYNALTDPKEKTRFYEANRKALLPKK